MDANKLLLSPTHAAHCSLFFTSHSCSLVLIPEIPPQGSVGPTQITTIQVEWLITSLHQPFFWLCNHRLVTLQSRTCDFVIAGSVLQSWFKPNFSNTSFFLFLSDHPLQSWPLLFKCCSHWWPNLPRILLEKGRSPHGASDLDHKRNRLQVLVTFLAISLHAWEAYVNPQHSRMEHSPLPFEPELEQLKILTNLQIFCRFKRNSIKSRLISTEILTNIEIIFCLKGNSIESILISIRSWSLMTSTYEVDFLGEEP